MRRPSSPAQDSQNTNVTEWSVEELIAMQFAYVKALAESTPSAGSSSPPTTNSNTEPIRDVVLSVPPDFTPHERDALVDALELAGLRLLALVHDGTAAALNYAMTRTFPSEGEWHVIYDAGAGGVRASVVQLKTTTGDSSKSKSTTGSGSTTHINVASAGWDRSSGGLVLDTRLRDILASDAASKLGLPLSTLLADPRASARLWKEASRVKAVLSANTDALVSIEALISDDKGGDYRSRVTRAQFEEACSDLTGKFGQPIEDALQRAGLGVGDITSVILTGGHSRVPMVQAAVRRVLETAPGGGASAISKIATSVNADEAVVLGAALYGASVSRQFRTKELKVADVMSYDVQVSYQTEVKPTTEGGASDEGEESDGSQKPLKAPRTINTLVFPVGSKAGSKKTLTFRRKDDFTLKIGYREPGDGYVCSFVPLLNLLVTLFTQ